jgi:UDP-glucoronosyl and UDP-glucosyl transferase.
MLSVLAVNISFGDSEAARILGAFHFNGKSHFNMYEALLKGLAARGHQVYVIGHLPQNTPIPNYTDISVEGLLPGIVNSYTMDYALELRKDTFLLDFIWKEHLDICQIVLDHPKVKQLINGDDKFDLIITEIYGPDCFLGLSYRFNASIISMFSSIFLPWANDRIGNPNHPAYMPNYFLPYTHHMTFHQRLINTVLTEVLKLGHYFFAELPMDQLAKQHFGPDVPPIAELKKKTSLLLANTHFSLHVPRPTVPALIEVGGLHINEKGKLPEVSYSYKTEWLRCYTPYI